MKKYLNKLLVPIIIIFLFAIIYLVIIPLYLSSKAKKDIFKNFEQELNDLKIEYQKEDTNYKEFGANLAYKYVSNNKTVALYIFNKNSSEYNQGIKDGYITSNINEETKLYGVFINNCVLFMESEFPNDTEILNIFISLSKEYIKNLK